MNNSPVLVFKNISEQSDDERFVVHIWLVAHIWLYLVSDNHQHFIHLAIDKWMLATFVASKIHNFKHPGSIGIHSATLATSGEDLETLEFTTQQHLQQMVLETHSATATSGFVYSLCQRTLELTQQSGFGSNLILP